MGTFGRGLMLAACMTASGICFGQDAAPGAANPANPAALAPVPLPDTNTPALPAFPADPGLTPVPAESVVTNAPAAVPSKPKPKPAPAIPSARGTVAKLDLVAMALTVEVKGKEQVYKITSKTRTFADGKPGILSDGKVGENVMVEYRTAKDKSHEALTIRFGGAAAAPVKAAAAPVKKAVKKKPAAKKDAHAVTPVPDAAHGVPASDLNAPINPGVPAPTQPTP